MSTSKSFTLISELPIGSLFVVEHRFAHTDIDYSGPLLVNFNRKTRTNQAIAKWYGAIFTCLSSRDLHIEFAGDLSTGTYILALRRLISRGDYPKSMKSDNGTKFVGAQRELSKTLRKLDNNRI